MAVRLRGGSYQADFMLNGQRYRASFADHAAATIWELETRTKAARGQPVAPVKTTRGPAKGINDLSDLIEAVTAERWRHKGDPQDAWLFADFAGRKRPVDEALSADTLAEYVNACYAKGNMGRTVDRKLAACSALLKAARARELISGSYDVPWQRVDKAGRIRFYSADELAQIYRMCDTLGATDFKYLFMFLAETGCRLGEAFKLTWSNVKGADPIRVSFLDTKNGCDRTVPMPPQGRVALMVMRAKYGDRAGPFRALSKNVLRALWKKLRARLAWMDDTTVVHTFRHTCASNLTMAGHPTGLIQKWLGHKTPAMTMRYSHLRDDGLDLLLTSRVVTNDVTNRDKIA